VQSYFLSDKFANNCDIYLMRYLLGYMPARAARLAYVTSDNAFLL